MEALLLAPAHDPRDAQWVVNNADALAGAEQRLRESVACLHTCGIDCEARMSDHDPVQAFADALAEFSADEIVMFTRPSKRVVVSPERDRPRTPEVPAADRPRGRQGVRTSLRCQSAIEPRTRESQRVGGKAVMNKRRTFTSEEARRVGSEIGIDWGSAAFDEEQFRMGMDVELEHGSRDPATDVTHDDPLMTGKIALAHLNEFADYYTRLARMEAEEYQDNTGG